MRKILLAATALLVGMNMLAQEEAGTAVLTGKNGTPILPQAGDFAIGVEATPYLNYLGNMFNDTQNNSLDLGSTTLHGRYYLDNNTALRLSLTIDNSTDTENYYVQDDAAVFQNPLSNAQVVDAQTNKSSGFELVAGIQKFRGYGRLRGFYGAAVAYGRSNSVTEYAYGNPITAANQAPSNYFGASSSRTLVSNHGSFNSLGLGVLAGVEYYFAPKICIGGELGLGYNYSWGGQSNYTTESWGGSSVVESTSLNSPGDTYSHLGTYRPITYGNLYLMFHF
jgi:hypothetical protein